MENDLMVTADRHSISDLVKSHLDNAYYHVDSNTEDPRHDHLFLGSSFAQDRMIKALRAIAPFKVTQVGKETVLEYRGHKVIFEPPLADVVSHYIKYEHPGAKMKAAPLPEGDTQIAPQ